MPTAPRSAPTARLLAVLSVLLLLLAPVLVGPAVADGGRRSDPTAANDSLSFGIGPAGSVPKGQVVDGRPYLNYVANPGATISDSVALFNFDAEPLKLQVYATDALTANDGAFSLLPGGTKPSDAGSWIRLDVPKNGRVTVPPRTKDGYGRLEIPLVISIPAEATPGDHVGGVLASLRSTSTNVQGAELTLDQRIGLRTYFRLTGELAPGLRIEDLKTSYKDQNDPRGRGRVEVSYVVHNVGNMRLDVDQDVSVSRWLADPLIGHPASLSDLLPGSRVGVRQVFEERFGFGRLKAEVTLRPRAVDPTYSETIPVVTASKEFWAWPWVLIALVAGTILLLLALYVGYRNRRRKRRQKERLVSGPAKSPQPAGQPVARRSAALVKTARSRQATRRRLSGTLAALVCAVSAMAPVLLAWPAQAERPDGSLGEVILETNDVTGVPRLALLQGAWGHEGGKKQDDLGTTFLSMNIADKTGGVTPESIAALHEKLSDGGSFDALRVAFVPYSADGSNERPKVEKGDTVADSFTWFGDFGFGSPLSGNKQATDSVATVSTGEEYIKWWDAGRPLQGYDKKLAVLDIADDSSTTPATAPQGKSILDRWPAGQKISMVLYLSDGTDEKRPGLPKVAVGPDGRALTSWLTFKTMARPGDPSRSSAGYEVLTGKGTGKDAPLPAGGLDVAISGGTDAGSTPPADGASPGAGGGASDGSGDTTGSADGTVDDTAGSGGSDGDAKSENALIAATPGGTPTFVILLILVVLGGVVWATAWLRSSRSR